MISFLVPPVPMGSCFDTGLIPKSRISERRDSTWAKQHQGLKKRSHLTFSDPIIWRQPQLFARCCATLPAANGQNSKTEIK
jgi:hypothetical protein